MQSGIAAGCQCVPGLFFRGADFRACMESMYRLLALQGFVLGHTLQAKRPQTTRQVACNPGRGAKARQPLHLPACRRLHRNQQKLPCRCKRLPWGSLLSVKP